MISTSQNLPEPVPRKSDQSTHLDSVMRIAEHARTQAVARNAQARLADGQRDTVFTIVSAQSDAERVQNEAERTKVQAATDRDVMNRAQIETTIARARAEPAQSETDKAKVNEESAVAAAERAPMDAQVMKKRQSDMHSGVSTFLFRRS